MWAWELFIFSHLNFFSKLLLGLMFSTFFLRGRLFLSEGVRTNNKMENTEILLEAILGKNYEWTNNFQLVKQVEFINFLLTYETTQYWIWMKLPAYKDFKVLELLTYPNLNWIFFIVPKLPKFYPPPKFHLNDDRL